MAIPQLQVIGGGKMGEALLAGLLSAGWAAVDDVRVVERLPGRAAELRERFPGLDVGDDVADARGHVVAVKPGDVETACRALAAAGSSARVLSIAAGVTLSRLEAALAAGTPVVRAMPNTPALVGAGAAAIAGGTSAGATSPATSSPGNRSASSAARSGSFSTTRSSPAGAHPPATRPASSASPILPPPITWSTGTAMPWTLRRPCRRAATPADGPTTSPIVDARRAAARSGP